MASTDLDSTNPAAEKVLSDATGGAGGTAKVQGSDWEIVRQELGPVFGSRLRFHVPDANPPERVRVNAVNARLMSADGRVRWLVDPERCPKLIDDFESVQGNKDGSGDIDKDPQRFGMLTHTCFAPGTLVSTPDGPTAIENIRTGDLVDTPIGPMPAVQAPRGRAPESMLTITTEDGTSFSCTLGHRPMGDVLAFEKNLTRIAAHLAHDLIHQGGLARTIGANQGMDVSGFEAEVYLVGHAQTAIVFHQAAYF